MHPTLISLEIQGFDLSIHSYGLMLALGILLGLTLARRAAPRADVSPETVLDLVLWGLVGGLLGARLLFMVVHAPRYYWACVDFSLFNDLYTPLEPLDGPRCFEALKLWEGGLVWYGGLLGGLLAGWIFCRRRGLSLLAMADLLMPSIALGHGLGRIGCFLAGCCWGKPCGLSWGARYPAGSMAWHQQIADGWVSRWAETTLPVHPTQLYEAAGEMLIFMALVLLRRRKRFEGQVLLAYGLLYSLLRSVVEVFRADQERGAIFCWGNETLNSWLGLPGDSWLLLSTSQLISLGVAVASLAMLVVLTRRSAA